MSRPTRQLTDDQIRIGATAGIAHVAIARWPGNSTATTRPPGRPDSTPLSHNDARQCTVAVT
ncbi:MAG: hypothetical protein WAN71_26520 [Mycobacterium sp.]|uniref:hypothetical protein n=1 Tax=Mycobacterium sp. TaxID=1785 RepID=UPI003BAE5EDA